MDNVTPIRRPPNHLHEAIEQVWGDFVAGRLDGGQPDGTIALERVGFEAWMRLPDDRRSSEYLFALAAYATQVLEEKRDIEQQGRPFDLAGLVVRTEFSYGGVLGDPAVMDEDDLDMLANDVLAAIPATEILFALTQAIKLAIPAVLTEALAAEEQRQAT